jgi:hypothetical protein
MLLLLRKKRWGKNGAWAEHTSGQGHFWTWPLPDIFFFRSRDCVTSCQNAPTKVDMAQLPLRMRMTYFRTCPITIGNPRPVFNMVTGTSPGYLPLLFSYSVYIGCVVLLLCKEYIYCISKKPKFFQRAYF